MKTELNDGGPAFLKEGTFDAHGIYFYSGMSLRDWFAGMTLQGLLAKYGREDTGYGISRISYEIADAMIAERDKKP